MKSSNFLRLAVYGMAAAMVSGCMESNDLYNPERIEQEEQAKIDACFDYNLTTEIPVTLHYQRRALVEIFDNNPYDQRNGVATKLYAAFTDDNGNYSGTMVLPKSYIGKTLYARSNNIGVSYLLSGTVTAAGLNISYATSRVVVQGQQTVPAWLLNAIESELPEEENNSAKLGKENDINIKVSKNCRIDVTFVHSGAGCNWWTGHYKDGIANCQRTEDWDKWVQNDFDCNLYYFTYTENNVPTAAEIEEKFINDNYLVVGYANQETSKNLQGTTVRLTMPDGSTEIPAGTRIGWVVTHPKYTFINLWDASEPQETIPYLYSIPSLNVGGVSQSIRYQCGTGDEKALVYGMEDVPIATGIKLWGENWNEHVNHSNETGNLATAYYMLNTDYDYNDMMFTVKADPIDAIVENETPVLDDGPIPTTYSDEVDRGTLLFEDMFPAQGDYDMNDVVIEYKLTKKFDNNNQLTELEYEFTPVWNGATFESGFSFMIDGYIDTPVNIFDNHKVALQKIYKGKVAVSGNKDALTWEAFNPFIRVKDTGHEVHLTKKASSPNADLEGLDAYQKQYVNNESEYPFAMKIPVLNYSVVTESVRIDTEYPSYKTWVESKGASATDWYMYKK